MAKESHGFIWWVAIVNPGKEVRDETMPSLYEDRGEKS